MSCASTVTDAEILALLFVIAPQFQTNDPTILAGYATLIASLRCMINEKVLGCCAALAFANLLAHYLTMQKNPSLGISTNLSEGQLSIGLANTVGGNFFQSTPYGQAYWQIVSKYKSAPYITNSRSSWYGPSCCGAGYGPWL